MQTTDTLTAEIIAQAMIAANLFYRAEYAEGTRTMKTDDAPKWIGALVYAAHDDGEFLPDDYRYLFVSEALDAIAEAHPDDDATDCAAGFADSTDVYTADLLKWVGSNLRRVGYVDSVCEDLGHGCGLAEDLMRGQYAEREEVFWSVLASLAERADEVDADLLDDIERRIEAGETCP